MRYHKILGVAGLTISLALTGCGQEDIIADTAYPLQEHLEGLALLLFMSGGQILLLPSSVWSRRMFRGWTAM